MAILYQLFNTSFTCTALRSISSHFGNLCLICRMKVPYYKAIFTQVVIVTKKNKLLPSLRLITRSTSLGGNHISSPLLYEHKEREIISKNIISECFVRKTPTKYKYAKKNLNINFQVTQARCQCWSINASNY